MTSVSAFFTLDNHGCTQAAADEQIVAAALAILNARIHRCDILSSPAEAKHYACLKLGGLARLSASELRALH